jgi:AraC family transcriptional regulator, transcriptional activator of pobA
MRSSETLMQFVKRLGKDSSETGQFNVFRIRDLDTSITSPHNRRDFYKMSLITTAHGTLFHANRSILINGPALVFSNPMIPYSWERLSGNEDGYFCLFTEGFIDHHLKEGGLSQSPLFKVGGNPVLFPEPETVDFLQTIYTRMQAEMDTDYPNKYELLRAYVQVVIHESLKIAPHELLYRPVTSSERISSLFLELLERQFPIPSEWHAIRFKNANEFAEQLAIHTNHLNKALKEATGKTTSEHIADRMLMEAKALLRNSDWSITSISHCLGFEHGANFNIFFKRQTGRNPTQFRKESIPFNK